MFPVYRYQAFHGLILLQTLTAGILLPCASDELCAQNLENNVSEAQDVNSLLQHRVTTDTETQGTDDDVVAADPDKGAPDAAENTNQMLESSQEEPEQAGFLHSDDEVNRVATTNSILEGEATTMEGILAGEVAKESIEVVLARYDEDISWSDPYKNVRTVYCKYKKEVTSDCHEVLPNVGREGHTYLYHIVKNYENLSQWTVFTQAQDPTIGYRGHRLGGGHIMPGTTFDSYVLPESAGGLRSSDGAAFVITGALSMDNLNHSLRLGYKHARSTPALHFGGACPVTALGDGWEPWWDLGWFKKFIGGRCNVKAENVPKHFQMYWDKYIKLPWPKNHVLFFTQGARFAVSRDRILQRPKIHYEELLRLVSEDQDPCWNYFNEWVWYYMIGAPTQSPCESDLVLSQANTVVHYSRHHKKRHQMAGH